MAAWKINCYKTTSGRNDIKHWYDSASPTIQAHFDVALGYLVDQPRTGWVRPKASSLRGGQCTDLYEIRIKADNKQIRPLGFFGPQSDAFTLLFCATEKGNKFVPVDACDQATKRRKNVEKDQNAYTCKCFCKKSGFDCCSDGK